MLGAFLLGLVLFGSGDAYADRDNAFGVADATALVLSDAQGSPAEDEKRTPLKSGAQDDGCDHPDSEEVCTVLMVLRGSEPTGPPVLAGGRAWGPYSSEEPPVPPPERQTLQEPADAAPADVEIVVPCGAGEPDSEVCTVLSVWRGPRHSAPSANRGPRLQPPFESIMPPVPPPEPAASILSDTFTLSSVPLFGSPVTRAATRPQHPLLNRLTIAVLSGPADSLRRVAPNWGVDRTGLASSRRIVVCASSDTNSDHHQSTNIRRSLSMRSTLWGVS